jgi:hypothetical protein
MFRDNFFLSFLSYDSIHVIKISNSCLCLAIKQLHVVEHRHRFLMKNFFIFISKFSWANKFCGVVFSDKSCSIIYSISLFNVINSMCMYYRIGSNRHVHHVMFWKSWFSYIKFKKHLKQ